MRIKRFHDEAEGLSLQVIFPAKRSDVVHRTRVTRPATCSNLTMATSDSSLLPVDLGNVKIIVVRAIKHLQSAR